MCVCVCINQLDCAVAGSQESMQVPHVIDKNQLLSHDTLPPRAGISRKLD